MGDLGHCLARGSCLGTVGTGVEPLEARLGEVLVERGNGRSGHRWSRQWMRITWQLVKDVISRMA